MGFLWLKQDQTMKSPPCLTNIEVKKIAVRTGTQVVCPAIQAPSAPPRQRICRTSCRRSASRGRSSPARAGASPRPAPSASAAASGRRGRRPSSVATAAGGAGADVRRGRGGGQRINAETPRAGPRREPVGVAEQDNHDDTPYGPTCKKKCACNVN